MTRSAKDQHASQIRWKLDGKLEARRRFDEEMLCKWLDLCCKAFTL